MRNTVPRNDALTALRAALIAGRNRIEAANPTRFQILAVPQYVAIEDQVPLLHEQFMALSQHSRERQTLALINAALDRFDQGKYGTCDDCDSEISMKRLQAVPWALRCIPCQERIERDSFGGNASDAFAACG